MLACCYFGIIHLYLLSHLSPSSSWKKETIERDWSSTSTVPSLCSSERQPIPPIYWIEHAHTGIPTDTIRKYIETLLHICANGTTAIASPYRIISHSALSGKSQPDEWILHSTALQQAYEDGHERVMVVEPLSSKIVLSPFELYDRAQRAMMLQTAQHASALLWDVIQLFSDVSQPGILGLGNESIAAWLPYHGCGKLRTYLIRRQGLANVLECSETRRKSIPFWKSMWLWAEPEIILQTVDEIVYHCAGRAFTVAAASTNIGDSRSTDDEHQQQQTQHVELALTNQSVLVLMSIRVSSLEQWEREMVRVKEDKAALCPFYERCQWHIHLVLTDPIFRNSIPGRLLHAPGIQWQVEEKAALYNKFAHLHGSVLGYMDNYDHVVLKDNDQRILGLPWVALCRGKSNAVLASPLRQTIPEAFLVNRHKRKRQHFQIHEALNWLDGHSSNDMSYLFSNVIPIDVPFLEMYFVLMDGAFARWFFTQILTPDFVNQASEWGPDLMWCTAAQEWSPSGKGCRLVPVVSPHEDTRQIVISGQRYDTGFAMLAKFEKEFAGWMKGPKLWVSIVGGTSRWYMDWKCHCALGRTSLREMFAPYSISNCASVAMDLTAV